MPSESLSHLRTLLREQFEAEHWSAAVVLARGILRRAPEDAPTLIRLGESLARLFNHDEAEAMFRLALNYCAREDRNAVYSRMGHLFLNRCDLEAAEKWYQRVIETAPHDAGGHIYLGVVHAKRGDLANAELAFRHGTQCVDGCIDEAYYNLGTVLRGLGRLNEARECYEKALELDPNYQIAQDALDDVSAAIKYSD